MNIILNSFIFVFGTIIGSFLNCVIYRLEVGKSFIKGRSFCPNCKHELAFSDLIPIFSFWVLKGKCRYCKKPISSSYPLVELATAIIFLLIFNFYVFSILNLFIACLLIVIFIYDIKHFLIPSEAVYLGIVACLLNMVINKLVISSYLLGAFVASSFLLSIYLISKGKWMGFGDVEVALLMGIFLGFPNVIVALFLSFFIGSIIGLIQIGLGKKTMKSEIPFGPFLVIGTFITMFLGSAIINWYLNLMA